MWSHGTNDDRADDEHEQTGGDCDVDAVDLVRAR
jgi:hypothetical protein